MVFKLTGVNKGERQGKKGPYGYTEIIGITMDGRSYKKGFFSSNSKLSNQLAKFGEGDYLIPSYDDSKYENIIDIAEASSDVVAAEKDKAAQNNNRGGSGGGGYKKRPDGGSRGDDTNRSAAIYLAKEFILAYEMSFSMVFELADDIYAYIKEGKHPVQQKDADDALTPPEED